MDADLYDEFGNYLGPDLEDSDASSAEEEEDAGEWIEEQNVTVTEPMALDGITGAWPPYECCFGVDVWSVAAVALFECSAQSRLLWMVRSHGCASLVALIADSQRVSAGTVIMRP